jgi:DNA-binding LacI/PurR family transcriptional regulator
MKNKTPKYIYAANTIREDIKNGTIVERLPGERVIAKNLGISYMTVRKAVETLVADNILVKIPAKGIYVNKKQNRKKTYNIGFFLDEAIRDSISSPYYSLVFAELEKAVVKRGYSLMFFSSYDDLVSLKSMRKVDGLVASFFPRIEKKIQQITTSLPVVVIGNSSSDKSIPSVIIDNFNGILAAMEHLFALGHRRIGFISGLLDSDIGLHRLNGYRIALARLGIPEDPGLIYEGDYSHESGLEGARALLAIAEPPTAIVCSNDTMALGALKAIPECGLKVPGDLSVMGFDDIEIAAQARPALTTIAAPIPKIAENAVAMLLALVDGIEPANKHIALPTRLVVRSSCAKAKNSK